MKKLLFWVSLSLASLLAVASATRADDKAALGTIVSSVPVPSSLNHKDVRRAILEAAAHRGWLVKDDTDEKVVLLLEKGSWKAQLTIVYASDSLEIYSHSTRSGVEKVPTSWVGYLKEDIVEKFRTETLAK